METKNTERPIDAIGRSLRSEFDDAAILRQPYEQDWVKALRQYKGSYDSETESRLKASGRSEIFLRITKVKCDAIHARLMDLLFPASGGMNWDIKPTPTPTVHETAKQAAIEEFMAMGGDPRTLDMERLERDIAEAACDIMRELMRDQLVETQNRDSYRKVCSQVISQAVFYGTGVLKGPLVESRMRQGYVQDEGGNLALTEIDDGLWPFFESVPIWSIFPDLAATDRHGLRFVWQEHLMTAKDLLSLKSLGNFDMDVISRYIRDNANGDATPRDYELDVRMLSEGGAVSPELKGRYRVKERWGYLSALELRQAGVSGLDEEDDHKVFSSNVWILGNRVIKAVLNPLNGTDLPFFFYYFSKDESSFFGEGVPVLIRDCQRGLNATVRMLVDNAAISSGPIVGINVRALKDGETTDLHPWKVFLFDDHMDMEKMMKSWNLQSNSQELLQMLNMFQNFTDELSTPRYMHGDQNISGAGRTASGLSMLMGAANISIKSLVKFFDDDITIPFITSLYHWNMQWTKNDRIKGDYSVAATGSSSLVARELRAQQHQVLLGVTSNPRFEGMTNDTKWLDHVFRDSEMPDGIVRSEDEYKEWKQEQMTMAARAQAEGMIQAMMAEAEKAGMDPQQALGQVMAMLAQQMGPAMAEAGMLPAAGGEPGMAPEGVAGIPEEAGVW